MKKEQLEKGSQLELNESTVLPKITVNYVRFNNQNIGVAMYLEDNEIPVSAVIQKEDKSKLVIDELNSGHPVDNWGKELLEEYFSLKFSH